MDRGAGERPGCSCLFGRLVCLVELDNPDEPDKPQTKKTALLSFLRRAIVLLKTYGRLRFRRAQYVFRNLLENRVGERLTNECVGNLFSRHRIRAGVH
jgi:hypothetical protein